jgi:hypothetical protein
MPTSSIPNEVKIGLLKDEYLALQKFYEDLDDRIMKIKGWSATIGLAAIGAGFYQSPYLWPFAALAGLVFWSLESVWKSFQYSYAPRIEAIEKVFRTGNFDEIEPLQIYTSWFKAFNKSGFDFFANMRLAIVLFPHIIPVVLGLALFIAESIGWMHIVRKG